MPSLLLCFCTRCSIPSIHTFCSQVEPADPREISIRSASDVHCNGVVTLHLGGTQAGI